MEEESKSEYIKIGSIGVDSGTLMIIDPCYALGDKWTQKDYEKYLEEGMKNEDLFKRIPFVDGEKNPIVDKGVVFSTGGDGMFDVFAKIEEDKDLGGKIITEIKITLV